MYAHIEIARMRHEQLLATAEQARHVHAVPRPSRVARFRRRPAA